MEAAAEIDPQEVAWDAAVGLAADLHHAHARIVEFTIGLLRDCSWALGGIRTPEHFLTLRMGLSKSHARHIVTIARRADELPATTRMLLDGRLSLDQAATVARHIPDAFDQPVAEFAQYATVTQLQRILTRYDYTLPDFDPLNGELRESGDEPGAEPEPDEAPVLPPQVAPATLTSGFTSEGRYYLRYDAPAEIGELVDTAIAEAKDWLILGGAGDADHPVTRADALAVVANRSLDAVTTASRRAKYRINVHLDTEGGWLAGRPRLPQHVVDGLTCDGELVPVWEREGRPVSVGRSRRVVPERTRRLILDRDRGCRYPGCTNTAWLEVHHLKHWSQGGVTDWSNLACLCTTHHDEHHRGVFTISGDPSTPDGLTFLTRHGWPIEPRTPAAGRAGPPPRRHLAVVPSPDSPPRRRYQPPPGDRFDPSWFDLTPATAPPMDPSA